MPSCGLCAINQSGSEVVLERYIVYKENDAPFCLDVPGGNAFNDAFLWLLGIACAINWKAINQSGSEVVLERDDAPLSGNKENDVLELKEIDAPFSTFLVNAFNDVALGMPLQSKVEAPVRTL